MEVDKQKLIKLRRLLHQYPEVSGKERDTAGRIKSFLLEHKPDELLENLGGYGIAAVYKGKKPGKTILFRCELDALPIAEINHFDHASKIPGYGHMCGHDGHMAIVAGMAELLYRKKPESGTAILLFQPAEENGEGAKAVLKEERFRALKPDFVFALHNLPGYDKNAIVLKKGSFTAAVNSIVIKLLGKTAHAGEPDKGINPALAIAEILQEVDKLNNPDRESESFRQITYVHASMGEKAYGTSAGDAELGFTFRCWTTQERDKLGNEIADLAKSVAAKYSLKTDVSYTESFHANENNDEAIEIIDKAAREEGFDVIWQNQPHRWGEDFGIFTQVYPGALFGLGAGKETADLHNPDYDFPDEIIETGVRMFYRILETST